MRTYELYFSGPRDRDPKFPFAPTVQEMYEDFQQVLKDSGYTLGRCMISTNTMNDDAVIEVNGYKP